MNDDEMSKAGRQHNLLFVRTIVKATLRQTCAANSLAGKRSISFQQPAVAVDWPPPPIEIMRALRLLVSDRPIRASPCREYHYSLAYRLILLCPMLVSTCRCYLSVAWSV